MNNSNTKLLRKLNHISVAVWALDCSAHVLRYFERKYPRDKRPRRAITAGQIWVRGEMKVGDVRTAALAAHAAARTVHDPAARAAARAAGQAAATAHVPGHAIHAAAYAVKAVALSVNASRADTAAVKERGWQYRRLRKLRPS